MNDERIGGAQVRAPDHRIEEWIGLLLRVGVLVAASVVAIGGALLVARHGAAPPALARFVGEPEELRSLAGLVSGALALHARSIIGVGLMLLVATPVARVALTLADFIRQRDWAFVAITGVVITALGWALLSG